MFYLLVLFFELIVTLCVTPEECDTIRQKAVHWKPNKNDAYNDADMIEERLYLGNVCAAHNHTWLKLNNITLTVSMAQEWAPSFCEEKTGLTKKVTFSLDDGEADEIAVLKALNDASDMIEQHLNGPENGNILVYCNMGISRSSSVILMFLSRKYKSKTQHDLLQLIQSRRAVVKPHSFFRRILKKCDL
jgi:predicted protein tyrosine phosphatase